MPGGAGTSPSRTSWCLDLAAQPSLQTWCGAAQPWGWRWSLMPCSTTWPIGRAAAAVAPVHPLAPAAAGGRSVATHFTPTGAAACNCSMLRLSKLWATNSVPSPGPACPEGSRRCTLPAQTFTTLIGEAAVPAHLPAPQQPARRGSHVPAGALPCLSPTLLHRL